MGAASMNFRVSREPRIAPDGLSATYARRICGGRHTAPQNKSGWQGLFHLEVQPLAYLFECC